MKTPEEIKKGLEICQVKSEGKKLVVCDPDECPYGPQTLKCKSELHEDAYSYIQQLEAEVRDARTNHQHTIDIAERQKAQIGKLKSVIVKLNNEKAPRWISVKERLPEEGELVVFIPTINQGSIYVGKLSHTGARGGVLFENRQGRTTMKYYAKYWMPLPEPPEVTKP